MIDEDLNKFSKNIKGKIKFNYSMKNLTWMNIGGIAKIFFIPETLLELKEFLSIFKNRKEKKGMLSNHLICSLHEGQKDLPLITFCSNGRR